MTVSQQYFHPEKERTLSKLACVSVSHKGVKPPPSVHAWQSQVPSLDILTRALDTPIPHPWNRAVGGAAGSDSAHAAIGAQE